MKQYFTAAELQELAEYDRLIDSLEMDAEDFAASKLIDELTLTRQQRYSREYYQKNREKQLACVEEYYKTHKEERKKYKAEWYQANRERIRKQQAAYRDANKERYERINNSEIHRLEARCRGRLTRQGLKLEKKRCSIGLSIDPEFCRYRISGRDQSGSDYPLRIEDVMQAVGIA